MIATKPLKPRACDCCGKTFKPWSSFQSVCKPACLLRKVNREEREKKAQAKERAKAERAMDTARKRALEPIKKVKAKAQDAFNDWIRARDADQPCISCGETNPPMKPGGQWDAGHFMGRGAYPELAFDEDNCHKQCKSCNGGSGKFAHKARTVAQQYEANLIERIGQERVDRLKGPHEVLPLERHALRQIATIYLAKLRELKKGNA